MTLDATNVRVAVTGAVSVAPEGATAPADADTTLDAAFKDLGYVSEDGVTETRDRTTDKVKAWQNAATVRELVTEAECTYTFALIETKKETVELYYGATVDPATGGVVIVPSATGGRQAFVVDVIDGTDFIRSYIPSGEILDVGDQVYAAGVPIGYEVTITCYPDTSIGGSVKKFYSSLADSSSSSS